MYIDKYKERKRRLGLDKPIRLLIDQAVSDGILRNPSHEPADKFYKHIDEQYLSVIEDNLDDLVNLTSFRAQEREIRPKEFLEHSIVFLLKLFQQKEPQLEMLARRLELTDTAELYVGLAVELEQKAKNKKLLFEKGGLVEFQNYPPS